MTINRFLETLQCGSHEGIVNCLFVSTLLVEQIIRMSLTVFEAGQTMCSVIAFLEKKDGLKDLFFCAGRGCLELTCNKIRQPP